MKIGELVLVDSFGKCFLDGFRVNGFDVFAEILVIGHQVSERVGLSSVRSRFFVIPSFFFNGSYNFRVSSNRGFNNESFKSFLARRSRFTSSIVEEALIK